MKRGKRFFENENLFIYAGAVIFILLAVALGIIMFMTSKTGVRIENSEQFSRQERENTEAVTSDIGKKVEEQENTLKENNNEATETSNKTTETKTEEPEKQEEPTKAPETTPTEAEASSNPKEQTDGKTTETKKEITFSKPTEGEVICEYAKDNLIYSETLKEWITHTAVDIKADKTSVIKSAADGVVKSIVNDPRYGLTVVIEHDEGYQTVYSNLLTAEFVVVGEEVAQGQTIGTAGNTASFESSMECHLHFELLKDGEYLDPTIYLK